MKILLNGKENPNVQFQMQTSNSFVNTKTVFNHFFCHMPGGLANPQ